MIGGMIDTCDAKPASKHQTGIIAVYVVFVTIAVLVYNLIAESEFSSILTLSAIFQCLAFSLLGIQALSSNNVSGISAKSLQLDAIALACRLSSTIWLEGYLPNDQSGDFLYQVFDVLSLSMVLWLLHRVLIVQRQTYEVDEDALQVGPLLIGAVVFATLLHGDLNDRPLFDALWSCGLNVSAISVLPQLWMMTHRRGSTPALTSHFVAVMAFSRALSGTYMWHAYPEITCEPWFGDFNHAGYAILAAHVLHLVLLGDFGYYYAKNVATSGLQAPLDLAVAWEV